MEEEREIRVLEFTPPETIEPYKIEISKEDTGPELEFYNRDILPSWLRDLVEE